MRIARELLGDAILKLVITKGVDVANVTHLGRSATMAQQVALSWQSTVLHGPGLHPHVPARERPPKRLDQNPRDPPRRDSTRSASTTTTSKPYHGWALVTGKGPRPMVPPDDPRHPG